MFLNSTRRLPIQIEDLDREIEGEEPFQSRIGSSQKARFFYGMDLGYKNPLLNKRVNPKIEREISQCDISPLVRGCLPVRKNCKNALKRGCT
jgi:hypothetical protein